MERFQTFQEFLVSQSVQIPILNFIINLIIAAILAFILNRIYIKFGNSLSNRKRLAHNFVLITMTTMLIISIVKSSLALSLGLVGALSIVRFRAAIKEPEELAYLFLSIAIGLGLGADQVIITSIAFMIISGIIIMRNYGGIKDEDQNLYLSVSSTNPGKVSLKNIVELLVKQCERITLKRVDESKETLDASFIVEFANFEQLDSTRSKLQDMGNGCLTIQILDNKGLL